MTARIRPASPADRPFVVEAARRLAGFHPPAWRSAEEIVAGELRSLEAFFTTPSPTSALLIAESLENARLGFAYLEELRDYFTLEAHGHVGMLVVREEAEGKGIGGALLRAAEGWARERGYRKLTLTVFDSNRAARAVYEHLGYGPETLRYVKVL
jgi:GNAT superfamily N-acetyltransferase